MSKLPKEKYGHLFLCVLVIGILMTGIWYGFLADSLARLKEKKKKIAEIQETLKTAVRQESLAAQIRKDLAIAEQKLLQMEAKMIAGDAYRWLTKAFLDVPLSDSVDIANLAPPQVGELTIWPKVPYKLASFTLSGTAYYQDFGKFLAKVENEFPHMRLQHLELEPASFADAPTPEGEKLGFRMQIATLVNLKPQPTNSVPPAPAAPAKDPKLTAALGQ